MQQGQSARHLGGAMAIPRSSGHRSNNEELPARSSHSGRRLNDQALPLAAVEASRQSQQRISSTSTAPTSTSSSTKTAKDRLEEYQATQGKSQGHISSRIVDSEDATIVQYLALGAYHLPGYTWKQDWWQFMLNNHPVFGICCHHALHPIKSCTRVVALVGSLVVGLAITNFFYLFYLWNPQFNQPLVQVAVVSDDDNVVVEPNTTLTTGMLLLWTLGGSIHATYNLLQWKIAACACCRPGGMCETKACCPSLGKHLLRVLVAVIVAMAVLIILLRVAITNSENDLADQQELANLNDTSNSTTADDGGSSGIHFLDDDGIQHIEVHHDVSEFEFLVGYLVENVLALFVYYPIGGTILFSGILGCGGKVPLWSSMFGGRPYEIRAEERRLARKQQRTGGETSSDEEDQVEDGGRVPVQHYRHSFFD